ncbi:MAG: hypothetical protein ACYC99_15460, partial [Candidatus Geothermincolia bacterium]
DVKLSFTMKTGQKAVVKPSEQTRQPTNAGAPPALELIPVSNPPYAVEVLQGPDNGWELTASADGAIDFQYKVRFTAAKGGSAPVAGEAPGGVAPPRAIASPDLKAFIASDVLMAPQNPSGDYVSGTYAVDIQTPSGENNVAPWPVADAGGYEVKSTQQLLSNFVAWGKITKVSLQAGGPAITAGFTSDYKDVSGRDRSAYGSDLMKIFGEVKKVFGERPDQAQVTVLITGAGKYGLDHPASESLRDSFVLFHGGSELADDASAAAAKGWINLWNGWSLVAKPSGGASWLQAGLPWFYSFRVAGRLGLMNANAAYQDFSAVYADYLTDPLAVKTSLADAESQSGAQRLLETKGASLLAALTVKLAQKTTGGSKNIEWFLGQLATKFNSFEGKKYSLVDISEILESGTGTSWDRFFDEGVGTSKVLLTSEWSTTDVFGSGGVVGGSKQVATKGSGKNWIYLAIAILVIFSIPFIFSSYIKRSIKIDVTMPKFLPDLDSDEEEGKAEQEDEDAMSLPSGNSAGEAGAEVGLEEVPAPEGTAGEEAPAGLEPSSDQDPAAGPPGAAD